MTKREELLALADERGYLVIEPPPDGSLDSVTIISPRGTRCIFQRQEGKADTEINEALSHELGHCEEDAFYTEISSPAARLRAEGLADRWSYRKMIPPSALLAAFSDGCTEAWQIAERLSVPERMVKKAVEYYRAAFSVRFSS